MGFVRVPAFARGSGGTGGDSGRCRATSRPSATGSGGETHGGGGERGGEEVADAGGGTSAGEVAVGARAEP